MNNLRKVIVKAEVGDRFECIKESDFFSMGKGYKVQSSNYDVGTQSTEVEFLDNDLDLHFVSEKFLLTNFKKQ